MMMQQTREQTQFRQPGQRVGDQTKVMHAPALSVGRESVRDEAGRSEVNELDLRPPIVREQDVLRLDVTVDKPQRVYIRQRLQTPTDGENQPEQISYMNML